MAGLLAVLSAFSIMAGASAQPAPPGPAEPLPPVPPGGTDAVRPDRVGAGIDPALAAVEVAGPELRAARARQDLAQDALDAATRDLAGIRRNLGSLAGERVQSEADLATARMAVTSAVATLRDRRTQLSSARNAEAVAERRLAAARAAVRVVAVAGYIGGYGPTSSLFIDDPALALEAGRRRVFGTSVGSDKVARVVARSRDRKRATASRQAAAHRVTLADAALTAAENEERSAEDRLRDVDDRIAASLADEDRQSTDVLAATVDRDEIVLDVLDARVVSMVTGADLPLVALDAYWKAADASPCPTEWWALAGIGRTESFHGTYGGTSLDPTGHPRRKIIGIALNGGNDTAVISDTDGGFLDGDTVNDRAVGPMQFIPSTWARWGADGDDDGVVDPHSLYDAAAAAARYLCAGSGDLRTDPGLRQAYFSYNHSAAYVDTVLERARSYQAEVGIPTPPAP